VALVDTRLSDAFGLEIVIQAQRAAPELPVVLLSDREDESAALAALRQGARRIF
jgi:DNA-binding NarL/FixJ family response regulator